MAKHLGRRLMALWLAASLAWITFIAWQALARWPHVPLDISATDAGTRAALEAAVTRHIAHAALLGFGVPALAYALVRALRHMTGGQNGEAALATSREAGTGPARILLMRHADKPADAQDIHLSEAGRARAEELSRYIPATFGRPDFIFAAARSKRSIRSIETVAPLAAALGLTVRSDIEDRDFTLLADALFSDPAYRGKTIVVCWHHGKLPEIAAALGAAPGSYPDPWPEETFNLILDLRFAPGSAPEVRQIVEPF